MARRRHRYRSAIQGTHVRHFRVQDVSCPAKAAVRTLRQVVRLTLQDPRFGVASVALFGLIVVLGLDSSVVIEQVRRFGSAVQGAR